MYNLNQFSQRFQPNTCNCKKHVKTILIILWSYWQHFAAGSFILTVSKHLDSCDGADRSLPGAQLDDINRILVYSPINTLVQKSILQNDKPIWGDVLSWSWLIFWSFYNERWKSRFYIIDSILFYILYIIWKNRCALYTQVFNTCEYGQVMNRPLTRILSVIGKIQQRSFGAGGLRVSWEHSWGEGAIPAVQPTTKSFVKFNLPNKPHCLLGSQCLHWHALDLPMFVGKLRS